MWEIDREVGFIDEKIEGHSVASSFPLFRRSRSFMSINTNKNTS
jgi:hypothetical protein